MFIGILLAMMSFVVSYSSLQSVSCASLQTSTVIRTFEERAALIAHRGRVVTITLKGYIFFGSAVKILEDVKSHVSISVPELSPQQLMELQLSQKSESSSNKTEGISSDTVTETSALLPRQAATAPRSYQSNGAVPLDLAGEFKQLDRSVFSFQRSSSLKSKTPSQTGSSKGSSYDNKEKDHINDAISSGNGIASTGSAAKKLFPDISIPLSPVGVVNSDISPSVVAAAASQGLSVYDMSPEVLQHLIEEKNRDVGGDNSYVGSFTSRENTSGFNNAKPQPLGRKLYPSANAANLPPVVPKAKSFQAPSNVQAAQAPSSSSQLDGDVEMGMPEKSAVSSTGKSLLTEGIKNGETTEMTFARSLDNNQRQHPFRRQSGNKIPPAPAPATTTAALDILWTQDTSRANSNNSYNSYNSAEGNTSGRPAGAQRHVSFDGDLPGSDIASSLPTRASSESVLATIWEQQSHRRKRANSIQSADITCSGATESTSKLTMSESLEILRLPSRDSSASAEDFHQASSPLSFTPPSQRPVEFGMTREKSFQEEYKSTKARRKAGENIHIPATPPPELVLQSLAREHKQREEKQAEENDRHQEGEIMTEYLVRNHHIIPF